MSRNCTGGPGNCCLVEAWQMRKQKHTQVRFCLGFDRSINILCIFRVNNCNCNYNTFMYTCNVHTNKKIYIYIHIHVRYIHIQYMHVYNGYLWTNIEIIYHQMKKTWHEHPAEALKISQKPWQHMHNHPSPNLNSEDRCSDFLWDLSHCDAFHDSASYCRDQDFFSRKKGGAFFQQSSSVKMPLANLTVSCLVVLQHLGRAVSCLNYRSF